MRIVGIDVGGTFTDFIVFDGQTVRTHKVLSSRMDPSAAVAQGLSELGLDGTAAIVHGSTLATNAYLERRGARIALLTTKGFEDLLEIGRQARGKLYDLEWQKPEPLVPRSRRIGVDERVAADGTIVRPLRMPRRKLSGIEAVAICFLHSYLRPEHERQVASAIRLPVAVSSDLLPEYREYERLTTTVLNAYVMPVMARYLDDLRRRIGGRTLRIMVSSGGQMSVEDAARAPVHTILSGPAGGACAVGHLCRTLRLPRAIAFDMGGTSTDVALYDGDISVTKESSIGELPVRIPMLEIHTVGAGGGSIARIDRGGALRVGPESAGADPGPACYGRGGTEPTVTDADVVLGRIHPELFFGGKMRLDTDAARDSVKRLARRLGRGLEATAAAILDVAGSNLERAVRYVSVERGHDPERFALIAFGGAGPLHACDLAERLSIRRIVVPRWPGLWSALGMALADEVMEKSRSVLCLLDERQRIERAFRSLNLRGARFVDARYTGQSYEIRTPWGDDTKREFERRHQQRYGYVRSAAVEIVNVVIRRTIPVAKPAFERLPSGGRLWPAGVLSRARLKAGDRLAGPSTVMEDNATTWIQRGWRGLVDETGNLHLRNA
ncbi:MAG: hydantoinase/oxoprolinase family protein [Planctomycetes bacterium]|nr:hydantoinase/oxoprolinase family protein [Planctomycetota bacterium]